MHKVLILSSYGSPILLPFGESMRDILTESFKDISMECEYQYYDSSNVPNPKDSIVIFMMPPDVYLEASKIVPKNNNIFVLWNLELIPLGLYNGESVTPKHTRRKEILISLKEDGNTDAIWLYEKKQLDVMSNHKKYRFVPIGYHKCLEPKKKKVAGIGKLNSRKIIMLGHLTGRRKVLWKVIESKLRVNKRREVGLKVLTHALFSNTKLAQSRVSMFVAGIDSDSTEYCLGHIRWHRLMCYAAAEVVIVSNSDLGEFGIIDKQYYMCAKTALEFAEKIHYLLEKKDNASVIANNMKSKLKKDFYMPNLLKDAITKLK